MMQNWHKKRSHSHFPVVALVLFVFIICSILYNEFNIQEIHPTHRQNDNHNDADVDRQEHFSLEEGILSNNDDDDRQQFSSKVEGVLLKPTSLLNPGTPPRNPSVPLDKSSTCSSTVKYSGRRVLSPVLSTRRPDEVIGEPEGECDFFSGRWIYDNISHPLHQESDCPYMSDQLACHKHGRPDYDYQYCRWQPHNCNLKRWNVTEMWEKLRGKRLTFVGDSLNRGQWLSLVCLLQSVVPADKRSMTPQAHVTTFRAFEYNSTIDFVWAPLLVESNSDHPVDHRLPERIIRPDSTLRHSSQWKHADILVFNTYLWWTQGPVKLSWSNSESGICEEIDGVGGMELALEAWADWMASNFDSRDKQAFFVTMSPTHLFKDRWEPGSEGNCYDERLPIPSGSYLRNGGQDLPIMEIVKKTLSRLNSKVVLLNITQLSSYRKDGHPTIYRKFWETLTPEMLSNPASYSDCVHWCLPGVQDVWNEILFQFL